MTSSACPAGFTLVNTLVTIPFSLMTNVVRSMPIYFLPYMDFSTHTPHASASECSVSASKSKVRENLSANFRCDFTPSGETPMTFALGIVGSFSWKPHASTVQPLVSSFG